MHAIPRRRVLAAGLGAGLTIACALLPSTALAASRSDATAAVTATASASTRAGTAGYCHDALGVSVVVDYQDLGRRGTNPGGTVIRCAPSPGSGRPFAGTGLQALAAAGFAVTGTQRWGTAFVCRIQNRPAATETVPIPGNPSYQEKCINTPPPSAYWTYWHTPDSTGGAVTNGWALSTQGAGSRQAKAGTVEGWSFAHDKTASTLPPPRANAVRPATATTTMSTPTPTPTPTATAKALPTPATPPPSPTAAAPGSTSTTPARSAGTATTPSRATRASGMAVPTRPERASERSAITTAAATTLVAKAVDRSAVAAAALTGAQTGDPAAAGRWLAGQRNPDGTVSAFGVVDYGLTVDVLWAMQATGVPPIDLTKTWSGLSTPAAVSEFTGPGQWSAQTTARYAGPSGKLLLAAATMGADVTDVGGRDLRAQTVSLIQATGPQKGRISDVDTGFDSTTTFSQALDVIGLAVTGDVPPDTLTFLTTQQCAAGWFRIDEGDGRTCDQAQSRGEAAADTDATALAIQALLAARDDGVTCLDAAIDKGVAYLAGAQAANGSFGGGVSTAAANSNSTGLAAAALAAAGETAAAAKAGAWVAGLQIGPAQTTLRAHVGAIAYDVDGWDTALTTGFPADPDQWRRATSQAVYAVQPVTFASLVPGHRTAPAADSGSCTTTPTSAPPTSAPPTTPTTSTTSPTTSTTRPATPPTVPTTPATHQAAPSAVPTTQPTTSASSSTTSSSPAAVDAAFRPIDAVFASTRSRTTTAASSSRPPSTSPAASAATSVSSSARNPATVADAPLRNASATSRPWLGIAPVLWFVLAGALLGSLAVWRPWTQQGRHTR